MYPQRSVMTCGLATALEPPHFNHAPVRGATSCWPACGASRWCFNPRTRVGCDRPAVHRRVWTASFNPRTRVGCDGPVRGLVALHVDVSIHAPAWGATGVHVRLEHGQAVSIHAPAWGATFRAGAGASGAKRFNPRTRVGCDVTGFSAFWPRFEVSIHAPAWGATSQNSP